MKRIFTISALAFSMLISAQQAGKAGELLKNEASTEQMHTQKQDGAIQRSSGTTSQSKGSILNKPGMRGQNSSQRASTPNYRWNQNYGYSEVFLRIPEGGFYTVEIGDQMMSNSSGKFRFFDLSAGLIPISIYENGFLQYRTRLNVRNNSRMVLDFFSREGLYLLDTVPVRNQTYGFNEWDDVWNNPYGNYYGNYNGGGNYGNYGNMMNDRTFSEFIKSLQRVSFDDGKVEFVKTQARNSAFTSSQIKEIMSKFSFDDRRLETGKMLYNTCVDKNNFFIVYDTFSFDRQRQALMRYVASV